jgi:hypothetical protein
MGSGVRGILDGTGILQPMTFLELQASKRKETLWKSGAALVEALVNMQKVRKYGASRGSIREVGGGREEPAGEKLRGR